MVVTLGIFTLNKEKVPLKRVILTLSQAKKTWRRGCVIFGVQKNKEQNGAPKGYEGKEIEQEIH